MAKIECFLKGDFYSILHEIDDTIMNGNISGSCEEISSFREGGLTCEVRTYERYSWFGGNRVALNLTMLQREPGGKIWFCVTTAGGSQGIFLKVNTLSESSFLSQVNKISDKYRVDR